MQIIRFDLEDVIITSNEGYYEEDMTPEGYYPGDLEDADGQ